MQETALLEISILGNDNEASGLRAIPDVRVISAAKFNVPYMG